MKVGLTGGIGSGKSTVAGMLADLGAHVVDADQIAHEVVAPGTPGLDAVAEAFPGVVSGGELDRAALADIVFADQGELERLEAITHPLIRQRIRTRLDAAREGEVVVVDLPLLVEKGWGDDFDVVVAVGADADVRRERLRETRGMSTRQVDERMAAQASDEERRAAADMCLQNDGTVGELTAAVAELWTWLTEAAAQQQGAR
ncbi:MAG TPA: dephospho-CoA kinase [Actinomycetales bacterium]|nr:dephospho-CoA kinase [Actinomycetales bacterium]